MWCFRLYQLPLQNTILCFHIISWWIQVSTLPLTPYLLSTSLLCKHTGGKCDKVFLVWFLSHRCKYFCFVIIIFFSAPYKNIFFFTNTLIPFCYTPVNLESSPLNPVKLILNHQERILSGPSYLLLLVPLITHRLKRSHSSLSIQNSFADN